MSELTKKIARLNENFRSLETNYKEQVENNGLLLAELTRIQKINKNDPHLQELTRLSGEFDDVLRDMEHNGLKRRAEQKNIDTLVENQVSQQSKYKSKCLNMVDKIKIHVLDQEEKHSKLSDLKNLTPIELSQVIQQYNLKHCQQRTLSRQTSRTLRNSKTFNQISSENKNKDIFPYSNHTGQTEQTTSPKFPTPERKLKAKDLTDDVSKW